MCVVSFVGDHYEDKWEPYKKIIPNTDPFNPIQPNTYTTSTTMFVTGVSQEEFDKLKSEVQEMKELLRKAKIYDEQNNEPNCEIEAKMEFLRQVAKFVGIDLDDVLKK